MQTKTIKTILKKKFDAWIKTIDSKEVTRMLKKDAYCTGGAIASMLLGERVNDFDFYLRTREAVRTVAEYYVDLFKQNPPEKFEEYDDMPIEVYEREDGYVGIGIESSGIAGAVDDSLHKYFNRIPGSEGTAEDVDNMASEVDKEQGKYIPVFLTNNAITLSNDIQIVTRFYGPPKEVHEDFDFVHCTCAWDVKSDRILTPKKALLSILSKNLKYNHSKYPLCAMIRTRKFIKRGWNINAGQYLKIAWDMNKLDLQDLNTLQEQLVGVDAMYFVEVLEKLRERKGSGMPIDATYLASVIDNIF